MTTQLIASATKNSPSEYAISRIRLIGPIHSRRKIFLLYRK
jgi:hypothetical protein